ncbi:MAG: branched-chain amino acid transaminase [Chloroflexota bacterium]
MKSDFIWMDGQLVPFEKATVHFDTPTLHYGVGGFEGIRCYHTAKGPAVFRLREHLERLRASAHILGLAIPYSVEQLRQAVHETIQANRFQSCYIRPLFYLDGPLGLNMDASQVRVGISTWEWGKYLGEDALEKGIHVQVSSFTRHHINVMMTKSKAAGNYVNSMLAKTLALRSGYDEAILLDAQGYVAECTGENLFLVRKGVVFTPPTATILEGITRESIITLAGDLGIEVREQTLSRDQLYVADEVFLSGTAAEVGGVSRIDYRQIGEGKTGPITRKLAEAFTLTIQGDGRRSVEWLDYAG